MKTVKGYFLAALLVGGMIFLFWQWIVLLFYVAIAIAGIALVGFLIYVIVGVVGGLTRKPENVMMDHIKRSYKKP